MKKENKQKKQQLTFISYEQDEKDSILKAIEFIKNLENARDRDPMEVFREGNCGNVFCYLKYIFGRDVHCYIIDEHVYSEYKDSFYDVRGRIADCPFEIDEVFSEECELNLGPYINNYKFNTHQKPGQSPVSVPQNSKSEFEYDRENFAAIDEYLDNNPYSFFEEQTPPE